MSYHMGQVLPIEDARQPLGESTAAQWFILTTPPQRERAASAWLLRLGLADVWFPTEEAWSIRSRGPRRKVRYERLIAPRYVFALFDRQPIWDVLFDRALDRISGVVGHDGQPCAIPYREMAKMKAVPQRLEALRRMELDRERAERLARAPVAGEPAAICAGPLAGKVVDVSRIDRGIASWIMGAIHGSSRTEDMRRLDGLPEARHVPD
ncbi:transcription termination/antitermination NusG family protein [Pseudoroseicyclus sp. H15]